MSKGTQARRHEGTKGRPLPHSALGVLCVLCASAVIVRADDRVINSKHDLSRFGPGPARAVDENEVCIFCHTPHNASPEAPLWNRHSPTTYYRIYRSRTLQARVTQPGPASKLCLSCHDGSIALGLTLDRPLTDPIPMTQTYMPIGSDLTNDLSDDHPIGFRYDRTLANRDHELRAPQLVDHRLPLGERGELECTACHDPHNNELGHFLRITEREGVLCTTCHQLDGWRLSAHALSPMTVPLTVTAGQQLPYRSMADNACRACHVPHSAPQREHLLYQRPSELCITCHDGQITPVINQRSGHHINRLFEQTLPPEQRLHVSRFVECTDCHNPHAVAKNVFEGPLNFTARGPLVPPALEQVPGVTIAGVPIERSVFYYEVCFRCHSDRPVPIRNRTLRQQDDLGNIRREFLPTAASAHPVAFPARGTNEVPSLRPELRTQRFISCQDCHNNPDAVDGGLLAEGPHGSRYDHLLVARYETRDYTIETSQAYDLCYRCHDRTSLLNDESFPLHRRHVVRGRVACSACHAPHGVSGDSTHHGHLINFDVSIVGGQRQYLDTGRFSGSCTLTCHGVQHVNFVYGK
jgi:predicted CXXCH cytochrome family protein